MADLVEAVAADSNPDSLANGDGVTKARIAASSLLDDGGDDDDEVLATGRH